MELEINQQMLSLPQESPKTKKKVMRTDRTSSENSEQCTEKTSQMHVASDRQGSQGKQSLMSVQ